MKPRLHGIVGVVILGMLMCVAKAEDAASLRIPQLRETPEQRETRLQWFRDAKFGMFVHGGPAAISGDPARTPQDLHYADLFPPDHRPAAITRLLQSLAAAKRERASAGPDDSRFACRAMEPGMATKRGGFEDS